MRRSSVSVLLSLCILALIGGAAIWLVQRSERAPAGGGRPGEAEAPIGGRDDPGKRLAAGAEDGEPAEDEAAPGDAEAEGEGAATDAQMPVSIEGRVTDASGDGVAGARVAAVSRSAITEAIEKDAKRLEREALQALRAFQASLGDVAQHMPSCLTAPDGAYALRGLPDGDHRVVVTHPEFLPHAEGDWIPVETGRKVRYDVELVAGQAISGHVRDSKGDPIAGARVRATPVETARLKGLGKIVQVFIGQIEGASILDASSVETDASGAFRLTSLEPGAHDLRAVKEGWAWGEARAVPAGTEDVVIALEPAIRVSGRVVSAAGEPVVAAAVVLRDPERDIQGPEGPMTVAFVDIDILGEKERAAATGEDGHFALDAFARGAYELLVRADGFPEHRRQVALEGAQLDLGDIVLSENREISGTVLMPDGRPVDGGEVWVPKPSVRRDDRDSRRIFVLEAGPSWSIARSSTDRRGAFRIAGLSGGSHEVAVLAEGYPGDLLEGVAAGSRNLTIVLERGLTIRGRVVDAESGEPVPGAKVVAEVGPVREGTADGDGRFELRGLRLGERPAGGTIGVRASLEGYREGRATAAFPDPAAAPVAEAEIELRRRGKDSEDDRISGIVHDAGGEPIAGALVWTEVPGIPRAFLRVLQPDKVKDVRSGADGTFALAIPGGQHFEVVASHPGLATARRGPFTHDGGKWPFVDIELGEGASLEGRVTAPDGAPVSGARIRVWRDAQVPEEATVFTRVLPQSAGETAWSANDGTYRLRRIEPGSYRLEARAGGYAVKTVGPVEVGTGPGAAAPARVDISLERGGSLAGRVVDPGGDPLRGVEVVAFPIAAESGKPADEDEDELVQTGALGIAAAVTRADGAYEIDHLPEGAFRVLARARGFEPAALPRAVTGERLPDLVLERQARIAGRVHEEAADAPVRSFQVRLERRDGEGNFVEDRRRSRDFDDARGRFACEGLRAGEWRVRVTATTYSAWEKTVYLEPGGEAQIDVALSPGCRIRGIVRRPDGSPIAGAAIFARLDAERGERWSSRSGEDGSFVFGGLDPGVYHVRAADPDHYAEGAEATAKVEISDGVDAFPVLVLRPAGRFLGKVRGITFEPPDEHMWTVAFHGIAEDAAGKGAPKPAPQSFWVWADESGAFQRESVQPGRYRLELNHRRRAPDTGNEWVVVPPEGRVLGEVEVRAGEMATFQGEAP